MKGNKKPYIVAAYKDPDTLLKAVEELRTKQISIADVFTPFPVHGLDHALGLKESRIPLVGFISGATGTALAFLMQWYMYTYDWPLVVGGKPHFPFPTFIPLMFEITVLLCAFGMVFAFLLRNKIAPGIFKDLAHPRQTDDTMVIVIETSQDESENEDIKAVLKDTGAVEIEEKELKL